MEKYCLYMHIFPNGKVYIGITKRVPYNRWGVNGNNYKNSARVYSAIQKYGWSNIEHKIVLEDLTKEEAESLEKEYIAEYRSMEKEFGYNTYSGGNLGKTGYRHSQEVRDKIKKALETTYPHRGRKFSEEHRRKLSESHKGKIPPNKGVFGRKQSKETVDKRIKTTRERHGSFSKFHPSPIRYVLQIDPQENEIVCVFDNIISAEKQCGIKNVWKVCNKKAKTAGGYVWKFADEVWI